MLELLCPYLAAAVVAAAELLEGWAASTTRPGSPGSAWVAGHPEARESGTRLPARHGRAEEASFILLRPRISEQASAVALVGIAADANRPRRGSHRAARHPGRAPVSRPAWCCRGIGPDTAIGLLAAIRERQGHTDGANAPWHTSGTTLLNREQPAALPARHGRTDELRAAAYGTDLEQTQNGLRYRAVRLPSCQGRRGG